MLPTTSRQLRPAIGLLALGLAFGLASHAGQAQSSQRSPAEIAAAVPIDVAEVMAGGSWQDGGMNGIYRTVVVVTGPNEAPKADVIVQWIGAKAEGGVPEIIQSTVIKDIADKKLPNAQVALEADKEDEAVILVTSYDADAKPTVAAFKASKPGQISATELPPAAPEQPGVKP